MFATDKSNEDPKVIKRIIDEVYKVLARVNSCKSDESIGVHFPVALYSALSRFQLQELVWYQICKQVNCRRGAQQVT